MKKLYYLLLLAVGISFPMFSTAPSVFAESAPGFDICDGIGAKTSSCKDVKAQEADGSNPVTKNLKIVLNILAFIAGAAAVIILIVNGLRLILSNGDSNGVSSARSGLIYVVIGIVIVVLAQSIVVFLLDNI